MKITFMGAGSTVFARNVLGDCMCTPALCEAEIALYDINEERLKDSEIILGAINKNVNESRATIKTYLGVENRKEALRDADFVVNAIQVGGYDPCTITDFTIAKKYGLQQTIADTLGIGGIFRALYPNELHGVSIDDSIASIERIFKNDAEPKDIAAIIIEPVQGEGGFYVNSPAFMKRLRAPCDEHGIMLIADEVQTGAGRTGTFFATEQLGIVPDLTTFAKSVGGGFPISGVCGKAEIMDAIAPGGLGGTYAGSPIACAAALAVLKVFDEEKLLERSQAVGEKLKGVNRKSRLTVYYLLAQKFDKLDVFH